ncbi:hypothetical protein [Maledivibacter halophilus]|nr:hypothetical protein [Maledivibacter halophilus]
MGLAAKYSLNIKSKMDEEETKEEEPKDELVLCMDGDKSSWKI